MERTLAKDTIDKIGDSVLLKGWVKTRRDHGKLIFLDVYDRSGVIQIVVNPKISDESYKISDGIKPQYVVEVVGKVNKRPEGSINKNLLTGEVEIEAEKVNIIAKAETLPFDMDVKELNLELPTLLDYRSLTLRHPKQKAIFKVQEAIIEASRQVATKLGCAEVFVPTIVASATEGGAEVFKVDYFDYYAYLAQSPQLYKQMLVPVFERVYTVSHAYRAEPSVTTRHLSESIQIDCEFGFVNFEKLLDLLEEFAVAMLKGTENQCQEIFKNFGVKEIAFGKIPRLTLRETQEIIFKETGRDNRKEKDLAPQDEIDICQWALKNHRSDLITITHFPTKAKPFYTKPDPNNPEYSLSYDLLFRGVEIMSGSQRINDYQQLVNSIKDRGMDPKNFEMYLQAFKYGMPEEGGFSFGLERITMCLLGLKNIREASLFPRDTERIDERLSIAYEEDKKTR